MDDNVLENAEYHLKWFKKNNIHFRYANISLYFFRFRMKYDLCVTGFVRFTQFKYMYYIVLYFPSVLTCLHTLRSDTGADEETLNALPDLIHQCCDVFLSFSKNIQVFEIRLLCGYFIDVSHSFCT